MGSWSGLGICYWRLIVTFKDIHGHSLSLMYFLCLKPFTRDFLGLSASENSAKRILIIYQTLIWKRSIIEPNSIRTTSKKTYYAKIQPCRFDCVDIFSRVFASHILFFSSYGRHRSVRKWFAPTQSIMIHLKYTILSYKRDLFDVQTEIIVPIRHAPVRETSFVADCVIL